MTAGISQGGSKLRSPLKRCRDGWEQLQAVVRARGTVGLIGIESSGDRLRWRSHSVSLASRLVGLLRFPSSSPGN